MNCLGLLLSQEKVQLKLQYSWRDTLTLQNTGFSWLERSRGQLIFNGIFLSLGEGGEPEKNQVLFPVLRNHLWLWLQTSLRTEGTIANDHFVEGVRFASSNRSAVSWSGHWHCSTQSHCWAVTFGDLRLVCPSTCFFTFHDSGFFYFLLSFRATSESPHP